MSNARFNVGDLVKDTFVLPEILGVVVHVHPYPMKGFKGQTHSVQWYNGNTTKHVAEHILDKTMKDD